MPLSHPASDLLLFAPFIVLGVVLAIGFFNLVLDDGSAELQAAILADERRRNTKHPVGTIARYIRLDGAFERVAIEIFVRGDGRRSNRIAEASPACRARNAWGLAGDLAVAWERTGVLPDSMEESLAEAEVRFARDDAALRDKAAAEELRRLEAAADAREARRTNRLGQLAERAAEERATAAKHAEQDAKRAAARAAEDAERAASRAQKASKRAEKWAAEDAAYARQSETDAAAEAAWSADPRSAEHTEKKRQQRRSKSGRRPQTTGQTVADWLVALGLDALPPTMTELKAARNLRIKEVHPDRGGSTEDAVEVNAAYSGLAELVA